MKKLFLFSLALMSMTIVFGQKKELKTKFGKVSDDEIKMTAYKEDTNAPAVVLFEKGDLFYTYNNEIGWIQTFERHIRIKIFKKEAYDYANITFPIYGDEKVGDLKGITYNLEGGKVVETKLNSDNIFTEKLATRISVKKINMPAVKEGSIIELKYSVTNNYSYSIPNWVFQDQIPTIWSEYNVEVPERVVYSKMSFGTVPFLVNESTEKAGSFMITYRDREEDLANTSTVETAKINYNKNVMRFVQANIPAIKLEKYTDSYKDYLSRIVFEIKSVYSTRIERMGGEYQIRNTIASTDKNSWQELGKFMYEDVYEKWVEQTKYLDEAVLANAAKMTSDKEKMTVIYGYFAKNFQAKDFNYFFPTQELKECGNSHRGTATEINLLFISYLRKIGIKAYPVMTSTRKHGKVISFYPNLFVFNKVITAAMIDGTEFLVNAAEADFPLGLLPYEDTNLQGLMLKEKEDIAWIALENKLATKEANFMNFKIVKDGSLDGSLNTTSTGYLAYSLKSDCKKDEEKKFVANFLGDLAVDGTISEKKLENFDKWNESSVKLSFSLNTKAYSNVSGDKIYLEPMLNTKIIKYELKEAERKFDLSLGYPLETITSFIYQLPEGYKVESAPKSTKIAFADNAITFEYLVDATVPNLLKINVRHKLKQTRFFAEEYADLKTFYTAILAKLGEQVVIAKM